MARVTANLSKSCQGNDTISPIMYQPSSGFSYSIILGEVHSTVIYESKNLQ